jgi:hypothetical protein
MAKLSLTDISSGYLSIAPYNANNTLLEAALENTLSRDGTTPNTMGANLDMNSNYVTNLSDGANNQDACTVAQLAAASVVANTTTAALTTIVDTAANMAATTVEGALAEIYVDFVAADAVVTAATVPAATLAAVTNGNGASLIGIEDAAGIITATDVEAALAENRVAIDVIEALSVTGTFNVDYAGFTTAEAGTWTYRKVGNMVTIRGPQIGATSNATTFVSGATDVPVAIRPASDQVGAYITRDNGTFILGTINVSASGQISFGGTDLSGLGGFTATGDKGIRGPQPFTYMLD